MFAPYLDIPLQIDNESQLWTKLYDNRDYFIFAIVYSQFIYSNIPEASAYVYISQLMRYSTADSSHQDFIERKLLLKRKLLKQMFLVVTLKASLRKLTWVTVREYLLHRWPLICSYFLVTALLSWLITGFATRVAQRSPLTSEAGFVYLSGAPEFTPVLMGFMLLILSNFVFMYLVPCCDVHLVFHVERCSFFFYSHLFCSDSCIFMLFVFIYVYSCPTPFSY